MAYRQDTLGRDTTAKVVAERLRDEIQHGTLAPGTRLRQNDVAKRFGVSTTPVREAFAQLQAEGLVRIDPHRGAVVFHPSVDDVLEFYEIREALESVAVAHAIPNLRKEVARDLGALIERMRRTEDARKWLKLNDQFHLRLYEGAARPRLSALIDSLRDASVAMRRARSGRSANTCEAHHVISPRSSLPVSRTPPDAGTICSALTVGRATL